LEIATQFVIKILKTRI